MIFLIVSINTFLHRRFSIACREPCRREPSQRTSSTRPWSQVRKRPAHEPRRLVSRSWSRPLKAGRMGVNLAMKIFHFLISLSTHSYYVLIFKMSHIVLESILIYVGFQILLTLKVAEERASVRPQIWRSGPGSCQGSHAGHWVAMASLQDVENSLETWKCYKWVGENTIELLENWRYMDMKQFCVYVGSLSCNVEPQFVSEASHSWAPPCGYSSQCHKPSQQPVIKMGGTEGSEHIIPKNKAGGPGFIGIDLYHWYLMLKWIGIDIYCIIGIDLYHIAICFLGLKSHWGQVWIIVGPSHYSPGVEGGLQQRLHRSAWLPHLSDEDGVQGPMIPKRRIRFRMP